MTIGMCLTALAFSVLWFAAKTGEYWQQPDMYAAADFKLTDRSLSNLRSQGVPEEVLEKLQKSKDVKNRKFATDDKSSGEAKLAAAVKDVVGEDEAAKYQSLIRQDAYLFKVSPFWLILCYAILTLAELMLSPMGLSLVSKVAPVRMRGLMMGGWFVAGAIGNKLTMIGVFWDEWLHSTFWAVLAGLALAMAFVLLFLLRPLKKAMPGV
jgi:MFS family permease